MRVWENNKLFLTVNRQKWSSQRATCWSWTEASTHWQKQLEVLGCLLQLTGTRSDSLFVLLRHCFADRATIWSIESKIDQPSQWLVMESTHLARIAASFSMRTASFCWIWRTRFQDWRRLKIEEVILWGEFWYENSLEWKTVILFEWMNNW